MQGHLIKCFTDNQNVVSIVKFGSKKHHLQDGAVSIFDIVLNYPSTWISSGSQEKVMRCLITSVESKILMIGIVKLDPGLFYVLDSAWDPHSVDCFASEHSALISIRSPDNFLSIISFV